MTDVDGEHVQVLIASDELLGLLQRGFSLSLRAVVNSFSKHLARLLFKQLLFFVENLFPLDEHLILDCVREDLVSLVLAGCTLIDRLVDLTVYESQDALLR